MKKNVKLLFGVLFCISLLAICFVVIYFKNNLSIDESEIEINLSKENNINYNNKSIKKIVKNIKKEDSSFNQKNYILNYNLVNEDEGLGNIFFTYYINDKIATSKEYLVSINNNKVDETKLVGTSEDNSNKLDEKSIINRVENFEKNKKKESLYKEIIKLYGKNPKLSTKNILTSDNKINLDVIKPKIAKSNEKYYYDYKEDKLSYQLTLFQDLGTNGNTPMIGDGEVIEIIID